jgi:predicted transcriptional regulator
MQTLTVRVDDELADKVQQLAARQDVSTASVIRRALREHVQRRTEDEQLLARAREGVGRVR